MVKVENNLGHKNKESDYGAVDITALLGNKVELDHPVNKINIKKFIYEISQFSNKRIVINLLHILRNFFTFFTWLVAIFVLRISVIFNLFVRIIVYLDIIRFNTIFFIFISTLLLLFLVIVYIFFLISTHLFHFYSLGLLLRLLISPMNGRN